MLSAQKQLPRAMAHPELSIKPTEKQAATPKPVVEKRIPKVPLSILVCTPDITSDVAQRCLKSLRETTAHIQYMLYVEDNNGKQPFVHAKAINRALDRAEGNLVICDDDIELMPGWLDAALDIAESQEDCGIIGYWLENQKGEAWGSAMWSGLDGTTARCLERLQQPCCIPSQCSACWFICKTDRRFDEEYHKYRFEHVFAMETWEDGKKFWYVPVTIKHDCCTQFRRTVTDAALRLKMCNEDEAKYRREWIDTGREWDICEKITPYMPEAVIVNKDWNHERPIVMSAASKVKRDETERRAVVTVAVGEYFKTAIPLMQRYARKVGADFFCIDETWTPYGTSPHYMKWHCNAILAQGYTRIAFVDADCLIMPNAPDIFDAVAPGTLGVYDEAPAMFQRKLKRKDTCERFVSSWRRHVGAIDYKYPGHYFNSGVMVFDATCNPFVVREDGVYAFNTDTVFDQTYLNVMATDFPKTLLDWRWNRMAIAQASELIGSTNMFHNDPYILHYCGKPDVKNGITEGLKRIMPDWKERMPGASQNGIYDFWRYVGRVENAIEIGSANGESAWIATDVIPNLKLICVDPWKEMGGGRYGKQAEDDFDTRNGWNANVTKMKMTSKEAAKKVKDGSVDVVYIDAMHEDPWITEDLALWLPKVRKGGYIGGHDYAFGLWPDLVAAVNKLFGGPDMVFQDSSWIVKVAK
jgi:hypothetical protein